jgi:hypothetical protein
LHGSLFLIAIANMGPADPHGAAGLQQLLESGGWADWTYFAGRNFHLYYESALLRFLFYADLPGAAAAAVVSRPLWYLTTHLSLYTQSYLAAAVVLLGASAQWFLVGYRLQVWLVHSGGWRGHAVQWAARHVRHGVIAIIVVTCVVVPVVHQQAVVRYERAIHGGDH